MKSILPCIFALLVSAVFAQKGTDHDKFARKFYQQFSYAEDKVETLLPDKDALVYISAKTGEPIGSLETKLTEQKKFLKKDIYNLSIKGQTQKNVIDGTRIVLLQESPIKRADIFLSTHWGQEKYSILLHNCVQTDKGWFLGDFVGLEGESREGAVSQVYAEKRKQISQWLADNAKDYTALSDVQWNGVQIFGEYKEIPFYSATIKSKLPDSSANELPQFRLNKNGQVEAKLVSYSGKEKLLPFSSWKLEGDKLTFSGNSPMVYEVYHVSKKRLVLKDTRNFYYDLVNHEEYVKNAQATATTATGNGETKIKPWIGPSFPLQNAEPYTQFFKKELVGKPVKGFYIDRNGNKVNAVIKYQEPELLASATSTLLLYKKAYDEPGFMEDETTTFLKAVMKDSVIAFFVGDQVFVPVQTSSKQWGVLRSEGAIRQVVLIGKVVSGGKTGYLVSTIIDKLGGKNENIASMVLSFKNTMAEMVADNKTMADKIRNKEEGYRYLQLDKIVNEYNEWFDKQYPGKVAYLFYNDGTVAWKKQ